MRSGVDWAEMSPEYFMQISGVSCAVERVGYNPHAPDDHEIQKQEHYAIIISRGKNSVQFVMSYDKESNPPSPELALFHIADRLRIAYGAGSYEEWLEAAKVAGFDAFGHEDMYLSMFERWAKYDWKMARMLANWYDVLLYAVKYKDDRP